MRTESRLTTTRCLLVVVLLLTSGLTAACGPGGVDSIEPYLADELPDGSSGTLIAGRDGEP